MKKLFTLLTLCFVATTTLQAQIIVINKPLKEFPDVYDLSTPLNAGITLSYFYVNGTENLWRDASTSIFREELPDSNTPDRIVREEVKTRRLNDTIKEVLIYKDSAARMIIKVGNTDRYDIWDLIFEDGRWVNFGENGGGLSIEGWRKHFYDYAPTWQNRILRSQEVKKISTDTIAFVNYIKQHGAEPIEFLLETLGNYPLVIYGEIHRRKVSWDLLTSTLQDPRFPETVGTIFMEKPAYQQEKFDRFYASKELDTDILLDIFRSSQTVGWLDRGEYDFLINVWKLNQTLPADKKIKVVPTDEQLPWKLINTQEDYERWDRNLIDRNTRMADVVENTLKTKTDKRNSLFVVGYGHAYRSLVPGSYSSVAGQEPALSAGTQLVQRLSGKNVFTILQHGPCLTNTRGANGLVRQGLFDAVFEIIGNKPVAFMLANSPFGAEPYDADAENYLDHRAGTFADNFDGYIFLQPLKDEEKSCMLYEIYSDEFIDEMQRRIEFIDWENLNRWLGIEGEVTKEKIIEPLKKECDGKKEKRWGYLFE